MINRLIEVIEYRDMIASLVKRDLRGRYKGSFFGFLWNFVNPLCQMVVYILVFSMIFRSGIENFPIYLIVGMMPWNFINESIIQGSGCVFAQADMVKKIYFPREVLVISTVTSRFTNFLINYAIAFVIIIATGWGINIGLTITYLPIVLIAEYIYALAFALILSSLDVYFRDIEYMCGVFMMVLIWITPVMYPMDIVQYPLSIVVRLHPMTTIINAYHDILYFKQTPNTQTLLIFIIASVAFLLVSEVIFMKLEKRFAEEM